MKTRASTPLPTRSSKDGAVARCGAEPSLRGAKTGTGTKTDSDCGRRRFCMLCIQCHKCENDPQATCALCAACRECSLHGHL